MQMTNICHWMKPASWKFSAYATARMGTVKWIGIQIQYSMPAVPKRFGWWAKFAILSVSAGWSHRHSRGGQRDHAPPKFFENIVILCFEKRFSKQNSVIRLKSNILSPQNFCPPEISGLATPLAGVVVYWKKTKTTPTAIVTFAYSYLFSLLRNVFAMWLMKLLRLLHRLNSCSQNRRQKVFNRETLRFCGGAWHSIIDKISTDL